MKDISMKTVLRLVAVFLIASGVLFYCYSRFEKSHIKGSYGGYTDKDLGVVYTFKWDNSFSVTVTGKGREPITATGVYKISREGNMINLKYTGGDRISWWVSLPRGDTEFGRGYDFVVLDGLGLTLNYRPIYEE